MADEIKLKAPTVEQQVVVNIQGEEKLRSFADTLEKISSNKNLQKYWKTQQELINDTTVAYNNFSKKASQDNAKELIKVTNALKAMTGTDLSDILPDFDKIAKSMLEAQKIAGNIDSAFSVKGFKEAFDSFEMLKAYGVDIQNFFSHFGVSADVGQLQKNVRALEDEVGKLTRRLSNAKNANEELRNEFENFKTGSGFADKLDELDNLKSEMSYIREEAEKTFRQFLKLNNVSEDGYDRDGFYDDNRFREYFENIQSGYMSASDAIQQFKREYAYLLEEGFKSNNDTFGLEQLQAFSNKLDSIFRQVEETSNKINDIISNGVLTKSVENLSVDSSLTDSQRSLFGNLLKDEESLKSITTLFQKLIEESNKTKNNELFNSEQLQQVLSVFDKIENSLSSLRSIISDVGDGEEFSPLLKMLNEIKEATSNIKLNFNLDLGNEVSEKLNQKVSQASARQLEAYRKLFSAMKGTGKTNKEMLKFFEPDEASVTELIGMYKGIIDRAEKQFKVGNSNVYKKYLGAEYDALKREITNANKQLSRADSKRSDSGILGELFGNTKDLSEVIEHLNNIVSKLDEISKSALEFKNIFKEGFNVTASVEEIDKLTSRVKELEDELSKVKLNPVGADKSNISSENISTVQQQEKIENDIVESIREQNKAIDETIKKTLTLNDVRQKQWEIIQKTNPKEEGSNSFWLDKPSDAKTYYEVAHEDSDWDFNENYTDDYTVKDKTNIDNAVIKGEMITVYSSKPIVDGNFVTPSKEYAQSYADDGRTVYSAQIDPRDIAWLDVGEGQVAHLSEELKEVITLETQAKMGLIDLSEQNQAVSSDIPMKDVFQGDVEKSGMDNITSATEEAVQAKKDFATANEGVQSSVDGSKSKLELEAELMESIAKNAREAANAKKEFVEANKKVKDSADKSFDALTKEDSSLLSGHSDNSEPSGIKRYQKKGYKAHDTGNHDNEKKVTGKEELGKALKELQSEIIASIDESTSFIKEVTDFYDSANNLVKTQMKVGDKNGSMRTYTTSYSMDKDGNATAWTSHIETQKIEQEAKAVQKLAEEKRKLRQQEKQSTQSSVDKALTDQVSAWKKIQSIREKIAKTDSADEINALQESKKYYQEQYNNANKILKANDDLYDKESQIARLEQIRLETNAKIAGYKKNTSLSSMESSLKSYQKQLSDLSIKPDDAHRFPEYQAQLDSLNKAIQEYRTFVDSLQGKGIIDESDITESDRLKANIEKLLKETKTFSSGDRGYTELGADKVLEKINSILEQNSAMSKKAKAQIKAYYNEILSGNPTRPLNEILDDVYKIVQLEREAGRAGKSWLDIFKDKKIYSFLGQAASMFSFYDLIRYGREGIDTIREFDDGLTKISYTMDMTKSQLNDLGKSVLDMANDLDSSINNAMQVSQIYANMNTSAEEIKKLSEPTLILSNLTGFDASTVADDIQAVTQQFDIAAESSMHIADVYDQISRNISVDYSKGIESIAEAVQVAGSTADQAGLSFEQLAAIVGKTVEKTRLEGSQVGNGLKTIMTRLSKVGELSEEVDNETLSQASESLKKVGIEVYNLDGSYREFDVIMGELAGKWGDLTDAEKSNISFNIAATRQTNLLSAVLSNFSDSMQLAEEATNANGNALENNQKWVDSFGGHLQSLENTAKSAWINILDSETIKGGVDVLNSLLKVVVELIDTFGILPTAAGIGGIVAGFKNIGREKCYPSYRICL